MLLLFNPYTSNYYNKLVLKTDFFGYIPKVIVEFGEFMYHLGKLQFYVY